MGRTIGIERQFSDKKKNTTSSNLARCELIIRSRPFILIRKIIICLLLELESFKNIFSDRQVTDHDKSASRWHNWFVFHLDQELLTFGTGADGYEAFKSKLKFQIQHEVFRCCNHTLRILQF